MFPQEGECARMGEQAPGSTCVCLVPTPRPCPGAHLFCGRKGKCRWLESGPWAGPCPRWWVISLRQDGRPGPVGTSEEPPESGSFTRRSPPCAALSAQLGLGTRGQERLLLPALPSVPPDRPGAGEDAGRRQGERSFLGLEKPGALVRKRHRARLGP